MSGDITDKIEKKEKTAAIVLAAGSGSRMNSTTKKQYMEINGKPVLFYALKVFQESFVDEIVLVTAKEDISYCKEEVIKRYGFSKVSRIVEGGKERYHSVYAGLKSLQDCSYVFIHDGARPMLSMDVLKRLLEQVERTGACVAGMPVKDTVKIADEYGNIASTPDRSRVWTIQTPQVFSYEMIRMAYEKMMEGESELLNRGIHITDDAMVVEHFLKHPVRLVEGSYENIKITTPEDLAVVQEFLRRRNMK